MNSVDSCGWYRGSNQRDDPAFDPWLFSARWIPEAHYACVVSGYHLSSNILKHHTRRVQLLTGSDHTTPSSGYPTWNGSKEFPRGWLVGNCESPEAVVNGISVFTAKQEKTQSPLQLPSFWKKTVSTWMDNPKYTQNSHYSSPCPKHWIRPAIDSSAQERATIGILQARKWKTPHDRIKPTYRLDAMAPFWPNWPFDITQGNRPVCNKTIDQEIAISLGVPKCSLHPPSVSG